MKRVFRLTSFFWLSTLAGAWVGCARVTVEFPETDPWAVQRAGSRVEMARMSERLGRMDLAEKFYADVLAKEPDNQQVHHRLGVLAARGKRWPEAEKHFNQAKRLGKVSAALLNDIAYSYYLQNRPRSAEIKLRIALKLEPENQKSRSLLALVLGEQGRFQEGLAEFRRVVRGAESSTGSGDAYAHLASAAPNLKPHHSIQRTHTQLAAAGVPFRNAKAKNPAALEVNLDEAIVAKDSEPSLKSDRKRGRRPMRRLRSRGKMEIVKKTGANAKRSAGKGILSREHQTPNPLSRSPTATPTKSSPSRARLSHVERSAGKPHPFSTAFPTRQASFHKPRDPQAARHVGLLNRPLFSRLSSWPHAWPLTRGKNE